MELPVLSWNDLKSIVASRTLCMQYYDNGTHYLVWAIDDVIIFKYTIWKAGSEPEGSDITQMTSDRTDFESNFKASSNKNVSLYQTSLVQVVKPSVGVRAWTFSHNFCDKTTWFKDAIRVVDESVGTGNGQTTLFNLDHNWVIDLTHGKGTDEDYIIPTVSQGGSSYVPVIKIDGIAKTERTFSANSGGDFLINYIDGTITFFEAPSNNSV